jgi:hypothetical protein
MGESEDSQIRLCGHIRKNHGRDLGRNNGLDPHVSSAEQSVPARLALTATADLRYGVTASPEVV